MLTIIVAFAVGFGSYYLAHQYAQWSNVWSIVAAVGAMFVVQIVIALILRKAATNLNNKIQQMLMATQEKIRRKQQNFMRHPSGSQKMMQQALEADQEAGIKEILKAYDGFKPLYLWNMMMKKQINTMRAIFLYQLKRYDEVDNLLKDCVFFDMQSISIKMARMFKTGHTGKELDKFYGKKTKRLRGEDLVLPAALYSWILVKEEKYEDAVKLLAAAKDKTDNEVLAHNWEMLVNRKYKQFTNAPLGDVWYSLALETPKYPKVQQQMQYRRR